MCKKLWRELSRVQIDSINLDLPEFQQPLLAARISTPPKRKGTAKKTTHGKRIRIDLRAAKQGKKSRRLQNLPPLSQKSSDESSVQKENSEDDWTDEGSDSSGHSNVSSEGNKNEDGSEDESEDGSDSSEDRYVIDETPKNDPMQETEMVREEMAELKAKMDEVGRRVEEESKKKLAGMKAQAAERKAERKAKQEERRRQMEAEKESSSGESENSLENPQKTVVDESLSQIIVDADGHTTKDIEDHFHFFSVGGLNSS